MELAMNRSETTRNHTISPAMAQGPRLDRADSIAGFFFELEP